MAQRKEARIFVTIWDDDAFRAHSPGAQRMYLYLLSQRDLSYCGVIALRERRWARDANGLTVDQVTAELEALAEPFAEPFREGFGKPLIVIDDDTGELLVRSLIRHDGIWKQPNFLKAARESAELIQSPRIRAALAEELRRLPVGESSSKQVSGLVEEFVAYLGKGSRNPSGMGSAKGFPNPTEEGSPNPSAKGSQGNRGTSTTCTTDSPVPREIPGTPSSSSEIAPRSSDPNDEHREDIERLCTHLADRVTANGNRPPTITKKWRDAARLLIDRDGITEEQIHAAIDWCQGDEFWRGNILSMPKLRDQFDQLRQHARRETSRASPASFNPNGQAADESKMTQRARRAVEAGRQLQATIDRGELTP